MIKNFFSSSVVVALMIATVPVQAYDPNPPIPYDPPPNIPGMCMNCMPVCAGVIAGTYNCYYTWICYRITAGTGYRECSDGGINVYCSMAMGCALQLV